MSGWYLLFVTPALPAIAAWLLLWWWGRMARRTRALLDRNIALLDEFAASVDATFDGLVATVEQSSDRMDATFGRAIRRVDAIAGAFGAERDLVTDADGRIVSGWAY